MKVLVLGASGVTGKPLIRLLLQLGYEVKIIVGLTAVIPKVCESNNQVKIIYGNINEFEIKAMRKCLSDCFGVVSCLGHNLTFKGIYGKPRKLVTEAVELVVKAAEMVEREEPIRFALMNTAGNRNRESNEKYTFGEKMVVSLIRFLLPPQSDNEKAALFLQEKVGKKNVCVEWVVLRPDSLIDIKKVTSYKFFPSPIRSAIFKPGKTSRINVGNALVHLLIDNLLWEKWKYKMPVIYLSLIHISEPTRPY